MKKPRIEVSRLSAKKARHFGALAVKTLAGSKGQPFSVLHIRMAPGAKAPPIIHARTAEFFLILKGSSSGRVGRRRRTFRAGDCVYMPAGTLHEFRAGSRGVELLDVFVPRLDMDCPDIVFPEGQGF